MYSDLRQSIYSYSIVSGQKGGFYQNANLPYAEVYLAFHVNRAFWLLFENYLCDFAKVSLSETEGYLKKYYISPKKTLKPVFLSVTLNGKWKAELPIGLKDNMSYREVTEVISNRLKNCQIPKLKFTFKSI
ncbi:hypothetical protein H6G74_11485 [Nostoc spongiaeforme FACHB-130]|uniref:Uncharacterized protein n=1 Tax=Nostoc spongiaeforme FACHB-130 TaxID=1357510 RepID=A0ABR8FV21_9NOSO|nr:hypothetical protein [Nostoc spongiaeforme]MBD2594948.1 hypothetical protein [Nostoc spongiaeforme FACHB-130]